MRVLQLGRVGGMAGDLDEVDEVSLRWQGKLWTVLTKCLSRLMEEV